MSRASMNAVVCLVVLCLAVTGGVAARKGSAKANAPTRAARIPSSWGEQHKYEVLQALMPAVLIETATLTCPGEEEWLWGFPNDHLSLAADRLRDGVVCHLN